MTFVSTIAQAHGVPKDHLLVRYLERKTKAVDRGSKARRSLGNLYALLVLAEDYVAGRTSRFTDLLGRMKALPFGAKLQNHPLDNRLNDEFSRQMGVEGGLLAEFYRGQKVWIGASLDSVREEELVLYRTGRTNANDGGIDFVLRPIGRLFQVTETLDFAKYFLDLEKINRYSISFVIKVDMNARDVLVQIRSDAVRSGKYTVEQINLYMSLFEEIFTLPDLRAILKTIGKDSIAGIKSALSLQFQLEYGLLD